MLAADDTVIDLARQASFRLGPLQVDPPLRRVSSGETLEPRVMQVLVALARANGAVVSRDELIRTCWEGRIVGEDSITRAIGRLRRLAEDMGEGVFRIETVPKVGYRLVGEVMPVAPAPIDDSPAGGNSAPPPAKAGKRRPMLLGLAALLLIVAAGASVWWRLLSPGRPEATMAFTGFQAIGDGVPPGLASQIGETILSAFSEDNEVAITRPHGGKPDGYTLGGTVARAGDTLRLSARIENGASGATLWSRVYEQPAAVSDRVAPWIAGRASFIARCGMGYAGPYPRALPDDVMRLLFAECDAEADGQIDRAYDLARRITAVQPDLAAGWSTRAYFAEAVRLLEPPSQATPSENEVKVAVKRAIELDPQDSLAWHMKIYLLPDGDLAGIDRGFQRALQARQSTCGCVYAEYAGMMLGVGRAEEARRLYGRARDVVPLIGAPLAGLIDLDAAEGRTEELRGALDKLDALRLDPAQMARTRIHIALWTKDYTGALDLLRRYPSGGPPAVGVAMTAAFEAMKGNDPAAKARAARALASTVSQCGCASPSTIGMQAALGDASGALAVLNTEVAAKHAVPYLPEIAWDPLLAAVRRQPGYPALAERVGLLRYWRTTKTHPDFCAGADPPPVCTRI